MSLHPSLWSLHQKDPPKWVCSLLQDFGISHSNIQASSSCIVQNQDMVHVALLATLQDENEPNDVMDVKSTFLSDDDLEEEVYVKRP